MANRKLRIDNGLSVGEIVIDAATNTITGLSTAAPSADGDVANKKYVDDSVSGFSATTIQQGDTSVVVADSGTGTITVTADGGSVASFAAAATTITASGAINLTAGTDVVIPANVGITFGSGEKIEGNNTDLTVTSGGAINLTAFTDVVIPANVGITFGSGEKIEGDNTNLTITSGNNIVLNATGDVTVANNLIVSGNLNVQGTETIVATQNLTVEDNIISTNSNISSSANMPRFSGLHIHRGTGSTATELDPYIVWDEQYDVTGGSGLGGTFTFLGSVHNEGSETPNSDFTLADVKCNIIEATATTAQYADIAERFAADAPITPGAVVMLGGSAEITETAEELSDRVFGVISTQPAYMMNNGAGSNETHPFVAMTGRTPVRVTGEVRKGDRLVSSSIRGTARAAYAGETINPFHVIGRALEDKYDDGIGMVNCVVRNNN